ncbi:cation:proton antiporter [Pararhodobacter aggregans]|uniref:Sodium:proton antiporter n=1 Tax=Pararhodobacter aggregans TaxID=404875 RepID=A0A2T7UVQ5_9RHOB|nr:cation:proton antiporter [Pararhodobacter aggregans]PTX03854.1 sodium/proton antiporter (CPA1 family) [Pararhodobacter aggregans]PVE48666.1 sodium:proton antiporter [Pararhodobacter aggregans]
MDIVAIVAITAGLFAVIGLSEPLAERLRLPATVILALLGIAIGVASAWLIASRETEMLTAAATLIQNLPIRSNFFLYVFLPTLIFQVSLTIDLRRMLDDWVPILLLAVVAVVISTLAVGWALYPVADLPLMACLMIGAIVSTTDPSAVVGIFRATPAPLRLARIVEGESLLNDAAAIALFSLFFAFVAFGIPNPQLSDVVVQFPWLMIGGSLIGWFAGRLAVEALARLDQHPLGQVSMSVALPYLTYILAEVGLGASGVVAVVAAGLALNFHAPGKISPENKAKLNDTWDLLGYWAGALIFVLAAILIPRLLADVRPWDLFLVGVTVVAALAARALILFGLMPLLTRLKVSPRVERRQRAAILWGGLRGAVTLALALVVTESFRIPVDIKRQVGIVATGFTLFTLIVQGTSLRWVIHRLGLDRLSPLDSALAAQVVAVALQTVRETVSDTARDFGLARETVRDEAKRFAERVDEAVAAADQGAEIPDRDRITLGLVALAGRERDLILEAFRDGMLPARLATQMVADADRLIEGTRTGGRLAYLSTARKAHRSNLRHRTAVFLHNRLRLSGALGRQTADRFEYLVALAPILRDLHSFIDTRIRRIHGKRVGDLLHDLLERRTEEADRALDGLRLQFPGYAEELERRLIRQIALSQEEREYAALVDDGLIGPELRHALTVGISRRRGELARRPELDLAIQRMALVAAFPLFADMPVDRRKLLMREMRTVYVAPGTVLLKKDEAPRQVWFIASGAVEQVRGPQILRLGPGEMFGHLALLKRNFRRGQTTAIAHCTLLTLDEARFLQMLKTDESLRQAVLASAEKRGMPLDPGALAAL